MTKFPFTLTCLLGLILHFQSASLFAQDEKPKPAAEEPDKEKPKTREAPKKEQAKEDADQAEEQAEADLEKAETAAIAAKLSVFKSLEGEWTGEEKIEYNEQLYKGKNNVVKWKDEWKGFFTNKGRYFEMTGKTKGDVESTYHWYVTYDTQNEEFRAWSFGSNGWGEYVGQLTDDSKAVLWEKNREGEEVDITDTFELRATGDKCTASGETKIVSKDGRISRNYAKQNSSYTRKQIEI